MCGINKMTEKFHLSVGSLSPPQEQLSDLLEHYQAGRLDDAENVATSITRKYPTDPFSWKVLGAVLKQTGRITESLHANQKSAQLGPQDAGAHFNLGNTLLDLKRLGEAETSYKKAIALKPDLAEAYSNLGKILNELGRLEEAEVILKQAIALKPDLAEAHTYLGIVLYKGGNTDLALKSILKANEIDPKDKDSKLLLSAMRSRENLKESEAAIDGTNCITALKGPSLNPLILNRGVEAELITSLYEMSFYEIDKLKRGGLLASGRNDARYGNGKCSTDFNLFQDSSSIIQKLVEDLTIVMMEAVKSDILIHDSFFNILGAGGGLTPHKHINELDKDIGLNLGIQKYSLVYYLSIGDQDCSKPGVLKLYEPDKDILPSKGMIIIFPASRLHSTVYEGKDDRIIIGVNFYSL